MGSLNISATGMLAQQLNVDVIANNIANLNTTAFKRQRPEFVDLLYQTEIQVGSTSTDGGTVIVSGAEFGTGVTVGSVYRIHEQGNVLRTGNDFDLAIEGKGFFQIQKPDGTTAYTRDGSFQLNANGQMVTSNGYTVLPGITIPNNAQSLTIGNDGTVSVTLPGQTAPQTVGQLQLANFVNPAGLDPKGQNLFAETASSGTPNTGAPNNNGMGALQQGFVETSNVNVVEELVQMIQTQRAYELNSKAVQTSDQMLQKLAQI